MTVVWPSCRDDASTGQVYDVVVAVTALGGAVGWADVPSPREVDDWLGSILDRVRGGTARLAVLLEPASRRLLGLGSWERLEGDVVAHNAEIHKVMVRPDARGHGHARTLVQALVDDARGRGIETLILDVRGNNHAAMRLYEAIGFEVYGRLPDFIAVGDERFDRVLYRFDLGRPAAVRRRGGRPVGPGASVARARSAHPAQLGPGSRL